MTDPRTFAKFSAFSLFLFILTLFFDFTLVIPNVELVKWGTRAFQLLFTVLALALYWREIVDHLQGRMYLVLFGWALVTAVCGINPSVGVFRWMLGIQLLLLVACFTATVPTPADLHRLLFYGFAVVATVNAAIFVVNPSYSVDDRGGFAGVLSDKNLAGQFNIVLLSLALYYLFATWRRRESVVAALFCVLALFFLIETKSKTSIFLGLATVTGCAFHYYITSRNHRVAALAALAIALACGGAALWAGVSVVTWDHIVYWVRDVSLSGRTTIWNAVALLISDRPWIGHGFGSFWQTQDLLNGLGARTHLSASEQWIDEAKVINQAHNGYLDLLLSVGIVGLVLVGSHVVALRRLGRLFWRHDVLPRDRYALMAVHSSMVTILLNNSLESTLFYSPFYSVGALMMLFLGYANWWHRLANREPAAAGSPVQSRRQRIEPTWSMPPPVRSR